MHVIPSSAQAAYDQASSPCKLAAPRIAASLDDMPLSVLCDPDRGTLEAVEFCGLHAAETSFVELEVLTAASPTASSLVATSPVRFSLISPSRVATSPTAYSTAPRSRAAHSTIASSPAHPSPKRFGNRWLQRIARSPTALSTDVFGKPSGLTLVISRQRT